MDPSSESVPVARKTAAPKEASVLRDTIGAAKVPIIEKDLKEPFGCRYTESMEFERIEVNLPPSIEMS